MRRAAILVLAVGLVASATRVEAQVTSAQVQQSIDRGIQYLRRHQRADGSWPYMNYRQGGTALATYSLLLAGVPPADPAIEKAIRYLKIQPLQFTYSVALVALALTEADPQEHLLTIQKCAEWLQGAQLANGMWTYGRAGHRGNGDNSNTQFAVLGLWAAERAGVRVDPEVWRKISKHFHETQDQDGAWGYGGNKGEASRYSMTAAGLGSLLIAHHRLLRPGEDCGEVFVDKHIAAGLSWMEARGARIPRNLYDLYGLERVGMLSNQSVVAGIDWYRDGAAHLVGQQQGDGSWFQYTQEVGTSLALLFLAKGRAPLVVSKLRFVPGGEESRVGEVEELVGFASAVFGRKMTWQTVDWQTPLERTLLAPILFLNHHEPIDLTEPQLEVLRKFVASGGTIVANACCEDFDLSFRKAMARAFPGRDLERLGDAHPIYEAEYRIEDPRHRFLEGIQWNCRLSVVYSAKDLSYGWSTGQAKGGLPGDVALRLGVNVLRFLVDRGQNLDRLRRVQVREGAGETPEGDREAIPTGAFIPAVIVHGGDWNPDPPVGFLFLEAVRRDLPVRTSTDWRPIGLDSKDLFNHPFLILKGHSAFSFSQAELARLRTHLEAGGFLYVEACCAQEAFARSVRELVPALFPGRELADLAPDHDLWKAWEGPLDPVEFTAAAGRDPGLPPLAGLEVEGRLAIVYSPIAVGCAIADHERNQCPGVKTKDAAVAIYERLVAYALGR